MSSCDTGSWGELRGLGCVVALWILARWCVGALSVVARTTRLGRPLITRCSGSPSWDRSPRLGKGPGFSRGGFGTFGRGPGFSRGGFETFGEGPGFSRGGFETFGRCPGFSRRVLQTFWGGRDRDHGVFGTLLTRLDPSGPASGLVARGVWAPVVCSGRSPQRASRPAPPRPVVALWVWAPGGCVRVSPPPGWLPAHRGVAPTFFLQRAPTFRVTTLLSPW